MFFYRAACHRSMILACATMSSLVSINRGCGIIESSISKTKSFLRHLCFPRLWRCINSFLSIFSTQRSRNDVGIEWNIFSIREPENVATWGFSLMARRDERVLNLQFLQFAPVLLTAGAFRQLHRSSKQCVEDNSFYGFHKRMQCTNRHFFIGSKKKYSLCFGNSVKKSIFANFFVLTVL